MGGVSTGAIMACLSCILQRCWLRGIGVRNECLTGLTSIGKEGV